MAENNQVFEKKLSKNYGTVQKEEIKVTDNNTKLGKDFIKNTVNLSKTLSSEMKEHTNLDKEIKSKYVLSLKEIKANHLTHTKEVDSRAKSFDVEYQKKLKVNLEKYNVANKELDKLIEQINSENAKLTEQINAQCTADIASSEALKVQIEENSEKEINQLLSTLKDTQDKHETLVVNLNEKKAVKLEKLKATSDKKVEKYNSEIEKEQLKIDKSINDLLPPFKEKLKDIENKLADEKEKYLKKESVIKSALESRVARHEKFLNKAITQRDNRSVKEHKKNIIGLEKESEKELKLLSKEHTDKYSDLTKKKAEMITDNKNKIASLETELVKFKEEKLYLIEICKVTLKDDLEISTLTTKQQLEDELNKYNEFNAGNERKQAEVVKAKDEKIEAEENNQVILKINLDKTNSVNEVKHQEGLAKKEVEFKSAERAKLSEEALSKIALDVDLAKLDNERSAAEKELVEAIKLNEEKELIEFHNNDFNKLLSINSEFLSHQLDLSALYNERAKGLLVYEEIELNNRIDLKLAFLESQKDLLIKDHKNITNKINQTFEVEKKMYDIEIKKVAEKALEDLASFELESNEAIETMIKKRNAFNPRAYKKEIKVLDKEIQDKKLELHDELEQRKAKINTKTALYNTSVEDTIARKELALKEAAKLNDNEQSRLDNSIELINRQRTDELLDIKDRASLTANDSSNFSSLAKERNRMSIEENTTYKNSRVEKEEVKIKEVKAVFEQDKHSLNNELEQALVKLEELKSESLAQTNAEKLAQEGLLESKLGEFESKIRGFSQAAEGLNSDQGNAHRSNKSKIDLKYNNSLTRVSNELSVKAENYKEKSSEVEKATNEESKSFDAAKKQMKRDYEAALSKGLSIISQKLQQDLKNI